MTSGAPFACRPEASRGRASAEPEPTGRTGFQRDRDRIVHSTAFRRLQYKTQVFVYHEGDHFRTRLTHSIEVAQIARSVSRALGLNEDLAEALALAHDLGHTPFGHAGEDALDQAMRPYGGFDHNDQAFRILTRLERRYAGFDGLNLTWETLEGLVKHNGPLSDPPPTIAAWPGDLWLDSYPSAEAQVASLADDVAYNNHDIDDGLRAGLFSVEDLKQLPFVGPVFADVGERYPGLESNRVAHEAVRRMIDRMVSDLLAETRRRIDRHRPADADAVRRLREPLVSFSDEMQAHDRTLKAFLFERMYRHYKVNRTTAKAKRVVREMFGHFLEAPQTLPTEWQRLIARPDAEPMPRIVADYVAGMTDRFAFEEHKRLFDLNTK